MANGVRPLEMVVRIQAMWEAVSFRPPCLYKILSLEKKKKDIFSLDPMTGHYILAY